VINKYYTFDDVLIQPNFSTISSRKDVDLTTQLSPEVALKLPIISANMDTITGPTMAIKMAELGGMGILHRFGSIELNVAMLQDVLEAGISPFQVGVSIGLGEAERQRLEALYAAGARVICIDVAHGAQQTVVDQAKYARDKYKDITLIVGNFATKDTIQVFQHLAGRNTVDVFKLGIGPGCFIQGTRVLMANGTYKNIEDIKLHDKVINKNGDPVSVIGTKFSGYRKVIKYKNNLWYTHSYATEDHLHWVGDYSSIKDINNVGLSMTLDKPTRNGKSKYKWKRLDDTKDCTLLLPKNINFQLPETFDIQLSEYFEARRTKEGYTQDSELVITPSYELGYIIGTYLGDGCTKISKTLRKGRRNTSAVSNWYFGLEEESIAKKVQQNLNVIFNVKAKIIKTKNTINVVCRNNFISRFLSSFGKRTNKHLPEKYLCSNKEYLKGVLEGLLDSDGSYGKDGRVSFTNTSSKLAELFMFCFYSINGYYPSCTNPKLSTGKLKGAKLENFNPAFVLRSVNTNKNLTLEYQINRINNLDAQETLVPTYDIEVDCPTHSFIANNAIVHNSVCSTRVKTGVGVPQLSAIVDTASYKNQEPYKIIADGGIRYAGDAAKALAAGADAIMIGGLLAGTDETPGQIINGNQKIYRGSASKESYDDQGKTSDWRTAEGISITVPYKGPVEHVIKDLEGGIRSSMTYTGSHNLTEFRNNARFIMVTNSTQLENKPHKGT
jgi:IMP dehydrogenase/GMP reductase/intein/homing endonuclease